MATSFDQLVRELKGFREKREIVKAMSKGIRAGVAPVRKKIRQAAIDTLPAEGGLNQWVAKVRINLKIKTTGKSAGIKLTGGRNSSGGRSDVAAIDRGRVRAPSWGRRTRGNWHVQAVEPGFFTSTAAEASEWRSGVDGEVDQALEQLRRG
jgi:hypothetical protein